MKNKLMQISVQKTPCKSCPFAGKNALVLSEESYEEYLNNLVEGGQHFCESDRGEYPPGAFHVTV